MRALDLGSGGWAWYTHHGGGRRARKVITADRDGPKRWERIQLDGVDVYRRFAAGNVVEETESLHLFVGDVRVLLVDDVLATTRAGLSPGPHLRYQYADQVGSTTLEADEQARIIGYEEFHPYGTTAYRARSDAVEAPPRRYRYSGAERDEESGFDDHGARSYAPRLGRWLSCDPSGDGDGPNRYAYCRGSPVMHTDPSGHQTGPLGLSGPYQGLATQQNWTREHFIPGRQFYWMLAQAFGRGGADQVWGRLYANADATLLVNTVADVKTYGAAATATLPEVIGDNTKRGVTALLRGDYKAGATTDVRSLYLLNRRNFVGSLLHAGFPPDEGTLKAYYKGVVAESRTLFVNERLLDAQQTKGTPIPAQTAGLINPATPPHQPPAAGPVPVVRFEKPAAGTAPPSAPASPAPSAPPEAAPPAAAPTAPPSSGWRGYALGLGGALAAVGLPIAVGYVAQLPFESEGAKRTASELGAGLTSTGIEWVGLVGAPFAATGLRVAATTVATSGGAAALSSAFGASTLGGIGAAGSGAVAAAGAAVAAAGAAGYAVGTIANKYFLQAQIDKLQLGSGAVGDWWYQHVLK